MKLNVSVVSQEKKSQWTKDLKKILDLNPDISLIPHDEVLTQLLFVDVRLENLENFLDGISHKKKAVFLVVQEGDEYPSLIQEGRADGLLVYPFRVLELFSKISRYQQILKWDEVSQVNTSFAQLVEELKKDLKLAESLQKERLPSRFPEIRGFKMTSRYLAGMKAGGDFFDLGESKDLDQVALLLSDSSTYGLSSAVLSALIRVTLKLSLDETRSTLSTVQKVYQELLSTLGEKDSLSLFFAVISRENLRLRYTHFGKSFVFHAPIGGKFRILPKHGDEIKKQNPIFLTSESEVYLDPHDRLVICSDGFVDGVGGSEKAIEMLDRLRNRDAKDVLNEFVFHIKSQLPYPEALPEQDCSVLVIDVEQHLLRVA